MSSSVYRRVLLFKSSFKRSIGPLHDPVTWYGINYTGTQITQWGFQNKGKSGWTGTSSFVLEVPLHNLHPSVIYSVPCDRIVQRAYFHLSRTTEHQPTRNPHSSAQLFAVLSAMCNYAHITIKPKGKGGGGLGNPREFDCDVYPQGGDFDHLIFQLQRAEEK